MSIKDCRFVFVVVYLSFCFFAFASLTDLKDRFDKSTHLKAIYYTSSRLFSSVKQIQGLPAMSVSSHRSMNLLYFHIF